MLDAAELNKLGIHGGLLICDIEGGEMSLLDPTTCEALRQMDILVEVHETRSAGVPANAEVLRQRFQSTHDITTIDDSKRARQLEGVSSLDEQQLAKATSEGRPYAQAWLWMKSKN